MSATAHAAIPPQPSSAEPSDHMPAPVTRHPAASTTDHHGKRGIVSHRLHRTRSTQATNPHGYRETGQASWYDGRRMRNRTASGERFDPDAFTAAHPSLPMNTLVRVSNLANGRSITVRINDRSKRRGRRMIDLTPRAAEALGMKHRGVAPVVVEALGTETSAAP